MRPFEFRIWDKASKVFIRNVVFDIRPITVFDGVTYANFISEIEDTKKILKRTNYDPEEFVFQQFTGLFDKNGKKIFEGDFLTGRRNPIVVEYDPPEFRFVYKELGCFWFAGWGDIYEPEIIGNIFENPEMYDEHQKLPKREILSK